MRIIAGSARGIPLVAPKGKQVRPTLDRVRESLFNILMPRISGARFADCFAGSGANGIEALSRGASEAFLVENDRTALEAIRTNLAKTRLADRAKILPLNLPQQLGSLPGPVDILFADPPYDLPVHEALLQALEAYQLLAPDGLCILEHSRKNTLPEVCGVFTQVRQKRYGQTLLSFYQRTASID